jgi:hypothetical protein
LAEIQRTLDRRGGDATDLIRKQVVVLRQRARQATELSERLQHVVDSLIRGSGPADVDWLELLEMTAIYERHLTSDEIGSLRRPKGAKATELEAQWTRLVAEVTAAMQSKLASRSKRAQALAWRWMRLVILRTSNNATLAIKLKRVYECEPRASEIEGVGRPALAWIGEAIAHARTALFVRYLTPAQTSKIRRRQLATISDLDAWPTLVALVRAQMDIGTLVSAPAMRRLAVRWQKLFRDSFCGDDTAMEARVRVALAREPDLNLGVGVSPALMKYIHAAIEQVRKP